MQQLMLGVIEEGIAQKSKKQGLGIMA